ncbi:sulfatase-like hydrolase/transferase [Candidatus Bathyarchaeota archaeon]|nr:sulfatase-like hydrolase/transferase [Candidatus Bathyarchaeota archaeon]
MTDQPLNVIIISIDTLRADHVGLYGYPLPTTPNIDAFFKKHGVLFDPAFSVSNCTLPGYTSMFTGLFPTAHDVVAHAPRWPIRNGVQTLAGILHDAGYFTAQVSTLADYPEHGEHLVEGFDRFEFRELNNKYKIDMGLTEQHQGGLVVPAPRITVQALDLLEECARSWQDARKPFFLFIHYWDPHTPYIPPDTFSSFYSEGRDPRDPRMHMLDALNDCNIGHWLEDWGRKLDSRYKDVTDPKYIVSLYDGEIAFADHHCGLIFQRMAELDLIEHSMVFLTSDHGETLDETNNLICGQPAMFSHVGLTNPNHTIPFILHVPGITDGGLKPWAEPACQLDIVPTVLDAIGLEQELVSGNFDGVSLIPTLKQQIEFVPALACELGNGKESIPEYPNDPDHPKHLACKRQGMLLVENTYHVQRAIRTNRWKYIKKIDSYPSMPSKHLYDLLLDPREHKNIIDEASNIGKILDDSLEQWIKLLCQKHETTDPQKRFGVTLREGFTHRTRAMYGGFDKDQVFFNN